jgi:hypothetical protein
VTADDIRTRLDAIDAYCAAAPVGPYTYGDIESVAGGSLYDPTVMIASVHWDNAPTPIHRFRHRDQADALGHFIANARTDLPAVVAALRDAHEPPTFASFTSAWSARLGAAHRERDALAAENARLRAQVQAVEALAEWVPAVRAALATTEAGEES